MLKRLQDELPKLWTDEKYSAQFRVNLAAHRDFQHALLHALKAAGKLLEMVEAADHADGPERGPTYFPQADVEKYLADIVISALRMAIKNPTGQVDLELAVVERVNSKMGAKIQVVRHPNGVRVLSEPAGADLWICVHCFDGRHHFCTGFGMSGDTGDRLACQCSSIHHCLPKPQGQSAP